MRALFVPPAVVATGATGGFVINFFPRTLTDVGDDQCAVSAARRHVERVAPRVAQAEAPDLFLNTGRPAVHERIRRRNDVTVHVANRHVHVDAQHLAKQFGGVLRPVSWIVGVSSVAKCDVEKAVRTEREIASVVIGERLCNVLQTGWPSQIETRRPVCYRRITRRAHEARNDRVPCEVGKVDIESAAGRIVGGQRHPQQSAFAARGNRATEVQEIGCEN